MKYKSKNVVVSDLLSRSRLPGFDFVVNPYIGCLHGCKYCYACFMKKYSHHVDDEWGSFLDVKESLKPIDVRKLVGKKVFMSSVTDCYNPLEETERRTRQILQQIENVDCALTITTKSNLVLKDLDVLKKMENVTVALSINTLDEKFRSDMDNASSIRSRLETLKILHENNIKTILFLSPIFPEITDFREIVEASKAFVDEFWFENLKLRYPYAKTILSYINNNFPHLQELYKKIYVKGDKTFWVNLAVEIERFCEQENVNGKILFSREILNCAHLKRRDEEGVFDEEN